MLHIFSRQNLLELLIISAIALFSAGQSQAQALAVGVVDYTKIFAPQGGYQAVGMANTLFTEFADVEYQPVLEMELGAGLADTDWQRFVTLSNMRLRGVLTEAEKAEFELLKKKASELMTEFKALDTRMKKNEILTEPEKARYTILRADVDNAGNLLGQMDAAVRQKTADEGKRLEDTILLKINEGIAAVAKAQKLTLVLNRNVRVDGRTVEQVVLWNSDSLDITVKVINYLNANFKPDMFNAKPAITP